MTGRDEVLELNQLLVRPLLLFRLAKTKYANLTGIGAAMSPGRWNLLGQEAIYTSANSSTTALERLVHTPKDQIPSDLALMRIQLHGEWRHASNELLVDENTKAKIAVFTSLAQATEPSSGVFAKIQVDTELIGVAVPSVIDSHWNLVLYPRANQFDSHVSLLDVVPYQFDSRLFPESQSS